jgi:hypothetical protein
VNDSSRYVALSDEQLESVNAACETFERALQNVHPIEIEVCNAAAPEEIRTPLFRELLAIELEWRSSRGSTPQIAEYRDRFPDSHDDIERTFKELSQEQRIGNNNPIDGAVIGGRYTLFELIGEGGWGRSIGRASRNRSNVRWR